MTPEDSFAALMVRLQAGDDQAAAAVVHRFTHRLIALARGRLDADCARVDPEDVLQSVFKSFFLRQADGRLTLENWQALWAVLAAITVHKCGRWAKHFHSLERDLADEVVGDGAPQAWRSSPAILHPRRRCNWPSWWKACCATSASATARS